jgi:hypothetical protein
LVRKAALVLPVRPLLGAGVLVATILTQLEFPARYAAVVDLRPTAVLLVAARNVTLAAAFIYSVPSSPGGAGARRQVEPLAGSGAVIGGPPLPRKPLSAMESA